VYVVAAVTTAVVVADDSYVAVVYVVAAVTTAVVAALDMLLLRLWLLL
jgi:hypothetical protein